MSPTKLYAEEQRTVLFQSDDPKKPHVLMPGEHLDMEVFFKGTEIPTHKYLRVVGGTVMPGKFKERGEELLEFTRLAPFRKRLADKLSGGMKQKLALVCAIIHKPKIIFLDEPTTGVDPLSRMDFWRILSSLLRTGITILMSTPYMDEAERCGRIALINNGRLMAVDTPHNVKQLMEGEILEVVCERPREAKKILDAVPGLLDVQSFGDRLNVAVANGTEAMRGVKAALGDAGLTPTGMRVISPSLENVFISLISK
jgi:ABC-2 type transport system ATP-binding protein